MSEHKSALNQMDGIPASLGFREPPEGFRYCPQEAVRAMKEMADEITALRQQSNQAEARISELEKAGRRAARLWSDAQSGYQCEDLMAFREVVIGEGESFTLHTQADALVDASNAMSDSFDLPAEGEAEESTVVRCQAFLMARADHLRKSAQTQEPQTVAAEPREWVVEQWPQDSGHGMCTFQTRPGIRVTHVPSGLTATCETHRSQHKNRDECMAKIRAQFEKDRE